MGLEAAPFAGHGRGSFPWEHPWVIRHEEPAAPCEAVAWVHWLLFLNIETVSWAVMSPGRPTHVHPLQRWGCLLPAEHRQGVSSPRKLLGVETNN